MTTYHPPAYKPNCEDVNTQSPEKQTSSRSSANSQKIFGKNIISCRLSRCCASPNTEIPAAGLFSGILKG